MSGWILFSASVGVLAAMWTTFFHKLLEDSYGIKRSPRWMAALGGFASAFVPLVGIPFLARIFQ